MSTFSVNVLIAPITATAGAALAGSSGALQGATWVASEFAKIGRDLAGTPGEISAVVLGVGTGAMGGFVLGSILGALSRENMIAYFLNGVLGGGTEQFIPQVPPLAGRATPPAP
jgi:hypothetical protein